ncbi:MAG TPA: hypothetical protein VD963_07460 [Phycisphaerales bacterium]|nr:hypothetical protein [Phycisphaerales bacterium]
MPRNFPGHLPPTPTPSTAPSHASPVRGLRAAAIAAAAPALAGCLDPAPDGSARHLVVGFGVVTRAPAHASPAATDHLRAAGLLVGVPGAPLIVGRLCRTTLQAPPATDSAPVILVLP